VLKRYWVLLALPPILAAGLWAPEVGLWVREQRVVTALLVATVLFVSGLQIDPRRLGGQFFNGRALLLVLGTNYCIAPLIALQLADLTGPAVGDLDSTGYQFLEALMLAAAQSSTLATALAMTRIARGSAELSLMLTLASSFAAVVCTPLVLKLTLGTVVELPVSAMMVRLALVIVLPVVLGWFVARALKRVGKSVPAFVQWVPQCIVLFFVYVAFSAAAEHLRNEVSIVVQFLLACLGLHAGLLVWSAVIAKVIGLKPSEQSAVLFGASQKSVPNGIYIWREFFAANPYGAVPIVLHQISQLVIGFVIAPWIGRNERDAN